MKTNPGTSASSVGPGLWPRHEPRFTESGAEGKFYRALKATLPDGWFAWHSMRLRDREGGGFTEADFIVVDPGRPSLLIVEVKGGLIEERDGHWFQNNDPMKRPPLDQAHHVLNILVRRFKDKDCRHPTMGVSVCFPDSMFQHQPGQDDLEGLVMGQQDLPYLDRILQDVMARAIPDPWPVKGPWLHVLHSLWGESWVPELSLGARIEHDRDERLRLDREQLRRLDEIEDNDRILVLSGAGTGKTLLAREAALRQARQGKEVLLLCYTEALAIWLKATIPHPNIRATNIGRFAVALLRDSGHPVQEDGTSEFWSQVTLRAAVDGLPPVEARWDAVIVDEGQDFSRNDWDLILECSRKTRRLWVFADEAQAFWSDRTIPEDIRRESFNLALQRPYRCPPGIQNLAECYSGCVAPDKKIMEDAVRDRVIGVITSSEERLSKQIGKEINRLLGDGLKPREIAVISVRGRGAEGSICHHEDLGGNRVVPATDPEADSRIICDTFLRFKGLERPAVIVTDLRLVSNLYEMRMHIAVSRATSLLRVVGVEKEMKKDPRLAGVL